LPLAENKFQSFPESIWNFTRCSMLFRVLKDSNEGQGSLQPSYWSRLINFDNILWNLLRHCYKTSFLLLMSDKFSIERISNWNFETIYFLYFQYAFVIIKLIYSKIISSKNNSLSQLNYTKKTTLIKPFTYDDLFPIIYTHPSSVSFVLRSDGCSKTTCYGHVIKHSTNATICHSNVSPNLDLLIRTRSVNVVCPCPKTFPLQYTFNNSRCRQFTSNHDDDGRNNYCAIPMQIQSNCRVLEWKINETAHT
jgi:hypothetical protein